MKDNGSKFSRFKAFAKGVLRDPDEDYDEDENEGADEKRESYREDSRDDERSYGRKSGYDYDYEDFSSSSSYSFGSGETGSTGFGSSASDAFGGSGDSASGNIYKMSSRPKFRLSILRLERLEDAVKVADNILTGNTITLIDLRSVPRDIVRRIIDFIDGVRYTCEAKMEIVADYTYVVVPKDVELTGDLLSQIDTSNLV
ncbi:MAG: cell division protein SepF [Acutalibacteraceae bacterium]|nr:cell division protein SepF [Oscillospiraceae bacterium]